MVWMRRDGHCLQPYGATASLVAASRCVCVVMLLQNLEDMTQVDFGPSWPIIIAKADFKAFISML
jgi:hypothetical protein